MNVSQDGTMPEATRVDQIRLVGVSPPSWSEVGDLLLLLFGSRQSQAIQSATISTIGRFEDAAAASSLVARWPLLAPVLRREAITALMPRHDNAALLLSALDHGQISVADFSPIQMNFLRTHADPVISQRASALLGPGLRERPLAVQQFGPALKLKGDAGRGREVFRVRCSACHSVIAGAPPLGPNLANSRELGKEKILTKMLEPNMRLSNPAFTPQVVETRAGESILGIVTDENATTIALRQPNGAAQVWPKSNIQSVWPQPWTLMPDGLEAGLTTQAVADLLEYVVTLR
jgi:putative heme-binding domain-containing protein